MAGRTARFVVVIFVSLTCEDLHVDQKKAYVAAIDRDAM